MAENTLQSVLSIAQTLLNQVSAQDTLKVTHFVLTLF